MMSSVLDREGLALLVVAGLVVVFRLRAPGFFTIPAAHAEHLPAFDALIRGPWSPPRRGRMLWRRSSMRAATGSSVLDLLKEDHRVRLDSELLLFGSIVLEIDSLVAAPDEYWVFYRDTTRGDRPPEACTTRTGETIRWVLKQRR